MMSEKEQLLKSWDGEFKTTLKVLKAYPSNRQDLRPHELSKTAKELAWVFALEEQTMALGALTGNIDFSKAPKVPASMDEVISGYERIHAEVMEKISNTPDEELNKTMKFHTAPKTTSDMRKIDILWGITRDQIHHRGQFSVYIRLAGGKVPSIYGPTADEPWS